MPALLNSIAADTRIALRNIFRQRRRTSIAITAIGFGIVAMMLSAGYIEWIYWANRELSTVNLLGHIQVSRPGYQQDGKADPYAYLLPRNSPALSALEHTKGVRSVTPRLIFNGLISHGDSTLSFLGEGIDPERDPTFQNIIVVSGKLLTSSDPKGIIMGAGLAANLGVKAGDTVVLLANTVTGGINAVEVHIRGLISNSLKAYDDTIVSVPIETARKLLRTQGSHLWVVRLQDTDMTARIVQQLSTDAALKNFEITPWTKLADFYNKTVALFSRQMNVVKFIIASIIILGITNTMTMSVLERTVEIGTAMALGTKRRRILGLFLLEGVLLGVAGGICGVVIGYLAAHAISAIGIPMPPAPGMSRGFIAGIIITPGIVYSALLMAVSTTLIASIYPAWRASRLVIVDALRHNR